MEVHGFALAAPDDFRIVAIKKQQPALAGSSSVSRTNSGCRSSPAMIILRRDKPDTYRSISAISGFRDLISMSVIPLSRAKSHKFGCVQGPTYSDTFAVYLWMMDNIRRSAGHS